KEVPIYIADYVLASYGSGAVMAVSAHDERDYAFARKYHLPMIQVLEGDISKEAMTSDAPHLNSEEANGLGIDEAKKVILKKLVSLGAGEEKITYRLRDWLFSRQRYWGEPIPMITLEDGEIVPVPDNELPLELPPLAEYKPSGTGESPLVHAKDWVNVTINGKKGTRETNTMPQWAGSCWYYLRYIDPHNDKEIASKELLDHWLPVDLYIGGSEHAVLHLLYARFWHKFLYDLNIVTCKEPFQRLFHQGMILGENGEKMSKSRGNVVNPDECVNKYGADALRLYEMFMGPLEDSLPWSERGLEGAKRYLDRVYRLFEDPLKSKIVIENNHQLDYIYNYTVKKVTNDYEGLQFNTAISTLMVLTNEFYKADSIPLEYIEGFIKLLDPVAPFVCEEIWNMLGHENLITYEPWPVYDESKLTLDTVHIAVQVNGKLRDTFDAPLNSEDNVLKEMALSCENVKHYTEGKEIKKVIVIKNKIVNIVL
ncbi:MAG: leucine--tRNA ligase, partial [Coprobacillus sp.]|nr:leucine--tRNA ligase [Coprobacillus sp.]